MLHLPMARLHHYPETCIVRGLLARAKRSTFLEQFLRGDQKARGSGSVLG